MVPRPTSRTDDDLEHLEHLHDGDIDIDLLVDAAGRGKHRQRSARGTKSRPAWQRVDERKEMQLLRAQLEDWEDWGTGEPDERSEAPGQC